MIGSTTSRNMTTARAGTITRSPQAAVRTRNAEARRPVSRTSLLDNPFRLALIFAFATAALVFGAGLIAVMSVEAGLVATVVLGVFEAAGVFTMILMAGACLNRRWR